MNRQLMYGYWAKWLVKMWKEIPEDPKKSANKAFLAGYEQGYEQRKLETSWRSIHR